MPMKMISIPLKVKPYHNQKIEASGGVASDIELTLSPPTGRTIYLHGLKILANTNQTITSIKFDDSEMIEATMSAGDDFDKTGANSLLDTYGERMFWSGDIVVTYDQAVGDENIQIDVWGQEVTGIA